MNSIETKTGINTISLIYRFVTWFLRRKFIQGSVLMNEFLDKIKLK